MYDSFDNTYQVITIKDSRLQYKSILILLLIDWLICVSQATIGIDFLSKTMYLEDRTVSPGYFIQAIIIPIVVDFNGCKLKACVCFM